MTCFSIHLLEKGPKRGQSVAAAQLGKEVALETLKIGMKTATVQFNGIGRGRESFIRALREHGVLILSVGDVTKIPHNGCRPRKIRRV